MGSVGDTGRDILFAKAKFDKHTTSIDERLNEGARLSGKRREHLRSTVMSNLRRHFDQEES